MASLRNKISVFSRKTTVESATMIKANVQKIEDIENRYIGIIKAVGKEVATINLLSEHFNSTNTSISEYLLRIKDVLPPPEQTDSQYFDPIDQVLSTFGELHRQLATIFSQLGETLNKSFVEEQKKYLHEMVKTTKESKANYDRHLNTFTQCGDRVKAAAKQNTSNGTPQTQQRLMKAKEDEIESKAAFEEAEMDTLQFIKETFEAQSVEMLEKDVFAFDLIRSALTRCNECVERLSAPVNESRDGVVRLRGLVTDKASRRGRRFLGVPLSELLEREGLPQTGCPALLKGALYEIAVKRAEVEGLFRISAPVSVFTDLKKKVQTSEAFEWSDVDTHVITGFLKHFLRALPEPLFLFSNYDLLCNLARNDHLKDEEKAKNVHGIIKSLPVPHQSCLERFVGMCLCILDKCNVNLMTANNMAVCLAPNMIYTTREQSDDAVMQHAVLAQTVVKILIEYGDTIFPNARKVVCENTRSAPSNPLPSVPNDELPSDEYTRAAIAQCGSMPERPQPLKKGASRQEYKDYMKANYEYTTWMERVKLQASKFREESASNPKQTSTVKESANNPKQTSTIKESANNPKQTSTVKENAQKTTNPNTSADSNETTQPSQPTPTPPSQSLPLLPRQPSLSALGPNSSNGNTNTNTNTSTSGYRAVARGPAPPRKPPPALPEQHSVL